MNFRLLISVSLAAMTASLSPAQQAVKSALVTLAKERGGSVSKQVVLIAGEHGQDQPTAWRIVALDPRLSDQLREFLVRNGEVVEEKVLSADEAGNARTPLIQRRIRLDSRQVFLLADQAAKKAQVGFDSLDYELRNKEFSNDPIWSVRLRDHAGKAVGELTVDADSGVILHRTWIEQAAGRPDTAVAAMGRTTIRARRGETTRDRSEVAASASTDEPGGLRDHAQTVWERTREGIQLGHEVIRSNVRRASDGLRGLFGRVRGEQSQPANDDVSEDQWE